MLMAVGDEKGQGHNCQVYVKRFGLLSCASNFFVLTEVQLLYSIALISAAWQSESIIHIYIHSFFRFFSYIGHYRILSRVPCAEQQVLTYFYIMVCICQSQSPNFFLPCMKYFKNKTQPSVHQVILPYVLKDRSLKKIDFFSCSHNVISNPSNKIDSNGNSLVCQTPSPF